MELLLARSNVTLHLLLAITLQPYSSPAPSDRDPTLPIRYNGRSLFIFHRPLSTLKATESSLLLIIHYCESWLCSVAAILQMSRALVHPLRSLKPHALAHQRRR
jgi:hypothetical protein